MVRSITGVIFTNCPNDGENVRQVTEQTLIKALFVILPNLTFFKKKSALHIIHLVYGY